MAEELMTDDEQLESLKHWFAENGAWIAGGIVLGVALLLGWRYYDNHRNQQASSAADKFGVLTAAMEKNDRAGAQAAAAILKKDYAGSPYADQAELIVARMAVDAGELANAVEPLTRVMNNSKDAELKQVARLRLARVLIDQGKSNDAIALLSEVAAPSFAARYHEVRGDAYYAKKDSAAAIKEYQSALVSADPRGVERNVLELKITDLGGTPAAAPIMVTPKLVTKVAP